MTSSGQLYEMMKDDPVIGLNGMRRIEMEEVKTFARKQLGEKGQWRPGGIWMVVVDD